MTHRSLSTALILVAFLAAPSFGQGSPGKQSTKPGGQAKRAPAEKVKLLAVFPKRATPLRTWMKQQGWESKRHNPKRFKVGEGRLHMVSQGDSVQIGTEKGFPLDPRRYSRIRFTIRIDQNPRGSTPFKKSGDDSAMRIYVAFDRGGSWISPPNSIAYTWTEKPQPAAPAKSPHYSNVRNVFVGHGRTLSSPEKPKPGQSKATPRPIFVTIERDLLADYRRCFPEEGKKSIPKLTGVMVKCDSNNTGTKCSSWISRLELIERVAKK